MSPSAAPLPGTFTDAIKALRELLALLSDVGNVVARGAKIIEKKRQRASAQNLSDLRFRNGGFLNALRAIAGRTATPANLRQLQEHLRMTETGITTILARLDGLYDAVRVEFGIAIADRLENLLNSEGEGRKFAGKRKIRREIESLIYAYENDPNDAARRAADLLEYVEDFNKEAAALHDMLLGHAQKTI